MNELFRIKGGIAYPVALQDSYIAGATFFWPFNDTICGGLRSNGMPLLSTLYTLFQDGQSVILLHVMSIYFSYRIHVGISSGIPDANLVLGDAPETFSTIRHKFREYLYQQQQSQQ